MNVAFMLEMNKSINNIRIRNINIIVYNILYYIQIILIILMTTNINRII